MILSTSDDGWAIHSLAVGTQCQSNIQANVNTTTALKVFVNMSNIRVGLMFFDVDLLFHMNFVFAEYSMVAPLNIHEILKLIKIVDSVFFK